MVRREKERGIGDFAKVCKSWVGKIDLSGDLERKKETRKGQT